MKGVIEEPGAGSRPAYQPEMNMPLVKKSGNFTTLNVIITWEGLLAGADTSKVPVQCQSHPQRRSRRSVPVSMRTVVVLPAPLGPRNPKFHPFLFPG